MGMEFNFGGGKIEGGGVNAAWCGVVVLWKRGLLGQIINVDGGKGRGGHLL